MAPISLQKELVIRSIKIVDMGYLYGVYGCLGIVCAIGLNRLFGKFDPETEDKKSITQVLAEIIGILWLNGVITYIIKNLVELIPFPFEGIYGFQHSRLRELNNATVFSVTLLWFQKHLLDKINYIKSRLFDSEKNSNILVNSGNPDQNSKQ
jgi:hypothetical protein